MASAPESSSSGRFSSLQLMDLCVGRVDGAQTQARQSLQHSCTNLTSSSQERLISLGSRGSCQHLKDFWRPWQCHHFSCRRYAENGEEEMLIVEDEGPVLIHPQDFRKQPNVNRNSLAYPHCEEEGEHLIAHESLDCLPSHSNAYKKWLQEKTCSKEWDRWLLMGLFGIAVGMLGFLTHQMITDCLIKFKWDLVESYLQDGNFHMTWICVLGSGLAVILVSSSSVLEEFRYAGAGAGMAAVLRAPLGGLLGGLLVALQEVSSPWGMALAWQTRCCCLAATFTADLLSSSFHGLVYRGHFGFFEVEKRILFGVKDLLDLSVLAFVPTILLGVLGGLLGALFVSLNLKINKLRIQFFNSIPKSSLKKTSKLLESVLILVCTTTLTVYLPYFFPCTPVMSLRNSQLRNSSEIIKQFKREVSEYDCSPSASWIGPDGVRYFNQTFNQAAALLAENGKQGIASLSQCGSPGALGYASLCATLASYFILSYWTAGSAVASGLLVPVLYTGALYGRIIGLILISIFGVQTNKYRAWIDPGLFAAVGAASFFSGVSRLTISLTIIMVEITNDVQSLLLIMLAVMVAKMVGALFNASLYSSLLKLKCIPYLDVEPFVRHRKKWLNLELFSARDVMEPRVRALHLKENVALLARLLGSTSPGGFPVVYRPKSGHVEVFQGTIKR